jgi:hypothetical protein
MLRSTKLASFTFRGLKKFWSVTPELIRKQVQNRIFYAIFQGTRVTNDAYGWRPPTD